MATNQTTNLHLPSFVGTDKPSWLGDWNSAMSAIDTAYGEVKGEAGEAKTAAATAQTAAEAAAQQAAALGSEVSRIAGEQDTMKSQIDTIQQGLEGITPVADILIGRQYDVGLATFNSAGELKGSASHRATIRTFGGDMLTFELRSTATIGSNTVAIGYYVVANRKMYPFGYVNGNPFKLSPMNKHPDGSSSNFYKVATLDATGSPSGADIYCYYDNSYNVTIFVTVDSAGDFNYPVSINPQAGVCFVPEVSGSFYLNAYTGTFTLLPASFTSAIHPEN